MNRKLWLSILQLLLVIDVYASRSITDFDDTNVSEHIFDPQPRDNPEDYVDVVNDVDDESPPLLNGIPAEYTTRKRRRQKGYVGQAFGEAISSAFKDVFVLQKNLFTWNSFKVITSVFPLFVGARMIDEKLQRCFYDSSCHKNINQMPSWCHEVAKASIALPIIMLGVDAFFSKDDDRRWTAQILLLGMPFVIWTKKLIKQMKFDGCLRPWNEHFSCENRSFGGFPSGHMAQALYMAVLYGSRYGPRFAVPLGCLAAFIGVTFVSCNRHYISQVVAGGAFGTIYALAASKLVDMKLTERIKLRLGTDLEGHPQFSVGVSW
jgi:hypothetical protein